MILGGGRARAGAGRLAAYTKFRDASFLSCDYMIMKSYFAG